MATRQLCTLTSSSSSPPLKRLRQSGFYLLPSYVDKVTDEQEQRLSAFHLRDLPSPDTVRQELIKWKVNWLNTEDRHNIGLVSIATTLKHHTIINWTRFPNVTTMLGVTLLAPVSSATVERANSALKFVKSDRRSTMGEERLNALLLSFIH